MIADTFNKTWSYRSASKSLLLSFAVSVGLHLTTLPTNLVNHIKDNLIMNASSVIPSGFVLTDEGFMVLAFQPNCKHIRTLL